MASKPDADDVVRSLLQRTRTRSDPGPERMAHARDVVRAAWLDAHPPRRAHWPWLAAAAAAVVMVAVATGLLRGPSPPSLSRSAAEPVRQDVASVRFATGAVLVREPHTTTARRLQRGDVLVAGTEIDTERGGWVNVALVDGVEVRLDQETSLRVDAEQRLALGRGAVYIDTATRRGPATPLLVLARDAEVRDVGTRFEVRLLDASLRVQVRDGRVQVTRGRETHDAAAGTALTLTADTVRTGPAPAFGASWDWVVRAAAAPRIDGRTLAEFLTWVTRESGRVVQFEDPALERSASSVVVYGSVDGLSVDEALDIVLPSCGLTHRLDAGAIVIMATEARTTR